MHEISTLLKGSVKHEKERLVEMMQQGPDALHFDPEASPFRIVLELDGDDPAFVNVISLELLGILKQEGYTLEHPYTGQRGGGLQILIDVGVQAFTFLKEHHALLSEGIQDLSGLVAIFAEIIPLGQTMVKAAQKGTQEGGGAAETASVIITTEIDGQRISVESTDLVQVEAGLELAKKFAAAHPAAAKQASPAKSRVTLKGQMTRPPRRRPGRRH